MKSRHLLGAISLITLGMSGYCAAEDCQISLSQPVVDYHTMRRDNIESSQQGWHKMADREVNINVFCPQTEQMAVLLQGAAGEKGRFLFGQSGGLVVKIGDITVDGKRYTAGKTVDQLSFTPESSTSSPFYLRNNEAVIALENNQVPSGKQMSFTVTLAPVLNESAFSNLTDQTSLESELTWSLLTK